MRAAQRERVVQSASAMTVTQSETAMRRVPGKPSSAKAWVRALELTAPIVRRPDRILPTVIEELAERLGDAPALLSARECLTYRALAERSTRYARWAIEQGLAKGDAVCLLMPNRPEYMAIWLGITRVGGRVALLNTQLAGPSLAHCVNIASPGHLIVAVELIDRLIAVRQDLVGAPKIWIHGASHDQFPRIDDDIERYPGIPLHDSERRPVTIDDRALCIYTSGTTGLPKAANVSHARVMQWSHWFAGLMDARSSVHQPRKPVAPLHHPGMAHIRGLGQPGGAGGVDAERTIVDGHGPALAVVQRDAGVSFDVVVDTRKLVVTGAVNPYLRRADEVLPHCNQPIDQLHGHDQMSGRRDIDAVCKRGPGELRVE